MKSAHCPLHRQKVSSEIYVKQEHLCWLISYILDDQLRSALTHDIGAITLAQRCLRTVGPAQDHTSAFCRANVISRALDDVNVGLARARSCGEGVCNGPGRTDDGCGKRNRCVYGRGTFRLASITDVRGTDGCDDTCPPISLLRVRKVAGVVFRFQSTLGRNGPYLEEVYLLMAT
jgi:hypothetical protein